MSDWDKAACLSADPDTFYPEVHDHVSAAHAKKICARCPVRQPCLDWALANGEEFGVWGGLSARERMRVRTMAGAVANNVATQPCGTPAAFYRHRRRGETACDECEQAHRDDRREKARVRRAKGRAA